MEDQSTDSGVQSEAEKKLPGDEEQRTRESFYGLLALAKVLLQIDQPKPSDCIDTSAALDTICQRLVELTRSILGCQLVTITIEDPVTNEYRSVAAVGLAPEQEQVWRARRPGFNLHDQLAGTPLASQLLNDGYLIFNIAQTPFHSLPNPHDIRTIFLAPMYADSHMVGILSLAYGGSEHHYLPDEIELARVVAQFTALVIERERLVRERTESQANELVLRESNRRMDEFLGIASHEIRTPLTTIKANIQLAQRRLKSSLQHEPSPTEDAALKLSMASELLDRADRQISLLNRLVGDLLDVARIRVDKLEMHFLPEPCDLVTIVREAVQEQQQVVPEHPIFLHVPSDQEVPVMADPDRIGQVITNYLTNAFKYSAQNCLVEVSVQVEGTSARVAVRDEGPGLHEYELERIWDRFYQAQGVEVQSGSAIGLGLGLHISRMIIERHHGQVGVQSEPGKGSTFWFTLPLLN